MLHRNHLFHAFTFIDNEFPQSEAYYCKKIIEATQKSRLNLYDVSQLIVSTSTRLSISAFKIVSWLDPKTEISTL